MPDPLAAARMSNAVRVPVMAQTPFTPRAEAPADAIEAARQPLSWWGTASAVMFGNLLAALLGGLVYYLLTH